MLINPKYEALDDLLRELRDVIEERERLEQLQYQRELLSQILRGANQYGAAIHNPNVIPSVLEREFQDYRQIREFKRAVLYLVTWSHLENRLNGIKEEHCQTLNAKSDNLLQA